MDEQPEVFTSGVAPEIAASDIEPKEAELDPEFEKRMEQLVDEVAEEPPVEPTEADGSNTALLERLRKKIFDNVDSMTPRDIMLVYIKTASLEEARLRAEARNKTDDKGRADLVEKAKRAMGGG